MGKPRGDELRAAIERGEVERTKKLLIAASPQERKALSSFASARLKEVSHRELKEIEPGTWQFVSAFDDRQRSTARLAVAACAARFHEDVVPYDHEERGELVELLGRIRPAWLEGAAEAAIARRAHQRTWAFARALVRAGLSPRPTSPNYVRGLVSHVRPRGDKRPLSHILLDDPDLLEDEVWRLFEVGGSGADHLTPQWEEALVELAREKKLSRDRLLDASLDALERDFTQFHAGWFSRFHEALGPSLEERAVRADRYARLLLSPIGPTVSFAIGALGALARSGRLTIDADQLRPALLARAKTTALAALKLGGDDPAVAVVALGHEAKEVQSAAIVTLERAGVKTAAIETAARERLDDVAASLRPRLAALLGDAVETPRAGPAHGAATTRPKEKGAKPLVRPSSLDPSREVAPIDGIDELLDRFAAALETPDEPDEVERVLDGLARLCALDVEDLAERRAPLRKRAQRVHGGRGSSDGAYVRYELARLALAWCDGELPPRTGTEEGPRAFLAVRLDAIGERVARREARPLLSAPTHRGGFIAPHVLVRRVGELPAGAVTDVADAALALLRLSPEGRSSPSAVEGKSELADALRHALGAKGVRVGATVPLWIAAARARSPGEDDAAVARRHPDLGPGAAAAGRLEPEFHERSWSWTERGKTKTAWHRWATIKTSPGPIEVVPPLHLSVSLHPVREVGKSPWDHDDLVGELAELRWAFTSWPAWMEPLFAEGVVCLSRNLDWSQVAWADRGFLEPLVDPTTPLGPMARLLLGLGLGAKEPGQHGLAIDAAIAALDDGRLEPTQFGESIAPLLERRVVLPARWAKTFAEVARASPGHADAVATTLQRVLRGPSPRDTGALLDLLHELLVERGRAVDDPAAIEWLRQVEGGKAARMAKALLALGTAT